MKPKRAYDRADWDKIGEEVRLQTESWPAPTTTTTLDEIVGKLTEATSVAIGKHTPLLRPTPYSKRWFTPDLKEQQTILNRTRRKWQESCAALGREDARSTALFQTMLQKRRAWNRAIEKAKTVHWKQFLDQAGEGHLWKAATYMKPRDSWSGLPSLKVGASELTSNEDKAGALMDSFFPKMDDAQEELPATTQQEIPWKPITELEISQALKAAKGSTAPGEDGLPTLI
jgi:hypothetical protein